MATSSSSSSSGPPPPATSSPLASAPYPYAFAPDIIRAHQKDAYFQGLLTNQLTDLHRRLLGARSAHAWSTESRTLADLVYLCLTTLLGNRTLGEEYCGLVQVEASSSSPLSPSSSPRPADHQGRRLPSIERRAAYIAGSILLPYGLAKVLPALRARLRARLQRNLARADARRAQATTTTTTTTTDAKPSSPSTSSLKGGKAAATTTGGPPPLPWSYKLQTYLLANLPALTSPAPVHALGLALFYFSGSYYELSKRFAGLRYVFASRVPAGGDGPSADRSAGYEVLGVLLAVQMAVQGYLHVRSTLASFSSSQQQQQQLLASRERSTAGGVEVSLDEHAYSANNAILLTQMGTPGGSGGQATRIDLAVVTHTPPPPLRPLSSSKAGAGGGGGGGDGGDGVRYDLADEDAMRWIKGAQQRKCTLCLEELKDPAATQCGHVFCWSCIGDWVREKPECPLCRREAMVQHILPLRAY